MFAYLVCVCFKCTMPKNVCDFGVARPGRAECAMRILVHKSCNKIVFGYLVWMCLKCTMPKGVCF